MRKLWVFVLFLFVSTQAFALDARQELRPWIEGRWAVVEVCETVGTLVIVHPAVGREVDLEMYNRFALFQGVTEFNKKWRLPALIHPVSGFQSARFVKSQNGDYGIDVMYRSEMGVRHEWVKMRDRAELDRTCDYLKHMAESQGDLSDYPMETDESILFETAIPNYIPSRWLVAEVGVTDGERLRGSLLPMMELGQILIDTPEGFQRIDAQRVSEIQIGLRGGRQIVRKTVYGSIRYAFIGGLTGLMAGGFYEGVTVKDQLLYGVVVGGAVGAAFGFLDGLLSVEVGRTFHLSSPKGQPAREIELTPTRIRLRF